MNKNMGRCSAAITPRDNYDQWHPSQCKRSAIIIRDGKPYCHIHDPEYIKSKREKSYENYKTKRARQIHVETIKETAFLACQAVNPTNPEKVAEKIEAAFDALKLLVTEYDNATKRLKELHADTLTESPTWVLARQTLDAIENKEEK